MTAKWVCALPQAAPFLRQIEAGRPVSARELAMQAAERTQDAEHSALWFQASADMALLAGDLKEAYSAYGRSLHQASGAFATYLSERADARKALSGEALTPAALSFWRSPAIGVSWDDGMERLAGCALLCQDNAFTQAAWRHTSDLASRAEACGDTDWISIAAVMTKDFEVHDRIHRMPELSDHVYWSSVDKGVHVRVETDIARTESRHVLPSLAAGLLAIRLVQLQRLADAMSGSHPARTPLEELAACAQFSATHLHAESLETALLALAGKRLRDAEEVLLRFERQDDTLSTLNESLQCELLYCLSRLRMLQGRQEEGAELYLRYARSAVQRVRDRHATIRRLGELPGTLAHGASDDVGARLPARYRRAYDWMLNHISESSLSVKDVAAVIGVTERALQQTFKRHIGDSPTEVMRRLRMQHIHNALIHEGNGRELIMDIAQRYGVCNRTTLATSYRKYYAQSPSKSMGLWPG